MGTEQQVSETDCVHWRTRVLSLVSFGSRLGRSLG